MENRSTGMAILQSNWIRGGLIVLLTSMSFGLIVAVIFGLFVQAGQIGTVISAIATILLVSLTGEYAEMTSALVRETKESREQDSKQVEQEQKRELKSLRRALYQEIGKVNYFEDLAKTYDASRAANGIAAPRSVYESNTDKIGLLTDDEIDYIIEYYTRLERVVYFIELQRKKDTTMEMDAFTQFYRVLEANIEKFVALIPIIGPNRTPIEGREETVRFHLSKLLESQTRALDSLKEELNSRD